MQILKYKDPRTNRAQRFQKITKFAQHAFTGSPKNFVLECSTLARVDGAGYVQQPGWRMGTDCRQQFSTTCGATARYQRVDQGQEDFVGSKPLGAARVQKIDTMLRQPVYSIFDEGGLADSGLSRDESDLSLSGQHALCYPVQQL